MSESPSQPRKDDIVLGGENPPPVVGVVLGGPEGVKQRLLSSIVEQRIAALKEALKYGEEGLNLVISALKDESELVQNRAYSILQQREEPRVKQVLHQYKPWQFFVYLRTTTRHSSEVNCSVLSSDGQMLITCSHRDIIVWDLETGEEMYSLLEHPVQCIAINPDGQTFISGDEFFRETIKVCDLKTGQEIRTFPGRINSLAISPDGQLLFVGNKSNSNIKIWDLKTGELVRSLKRCGGNIMAFSSNGQTLVIGNNGHVNIWGLPSA